MKKWLIASLVLLSLSLFGCSFKQDGKSDNLLFKHVFTKELFELINPTYEVSQKTLDHDHAITDNNDYIIVFADKSVYHLETDKFLEIDKATTTNISLYFNYFIVETDNKYMVRSYLTGEKLLDLVKVDTRYEFNFENIVVHETIEGVEKETKRYHFAGRALVEKSNEENPMGDVNFYEYGDYKVTRNSKGVTYFKDDKFYAYYGYENNLDEAFFLENGSLLALYTYELPSDSSNYKYLRSGRKFGFHYVLFDTVKKQAQPVSIDFIIRSIIPKNKQFRMNIDNLAIYSRIDENTKEVLSQQYYASMSKDAKTFVTAKFEFGDLDSFQPIAHNLFISERDNGVAVIDGDNKLLQYITYDTNDYNYKVFSNATLLLHNYSTRAVFIYNLKTGEMIKKGLEYVADVGNNTHILKDSDKHYVFNGELKALEGPANRTRDGIYQVESEGETKYYFYDGTFILKSANPVVFVKHYLEKQEIFIISYLKEGAKAYIIFKRTYTSDMMFT